MVDFFPAAKDDITREGAGEGASPPRKGNGRDGYKGRGGGKGMNTGMGERGREVGREGGEGGGGFDTRLRWLWVLTI